MRAHALAVALVAALALLAAVVSTRRAPARTVLWTEVSARASLSSSPPPPRFTAITWCLSARRR